MEPHQFQPKNHKGPRRENEDIIGELQDKAKDEMEELMKEGYPEDEDEKDPKGYL